MSADQVYYLDPTTGLPFVIPVPINQLPPPHLPPTPLAAPRSPELAPLGSFQNPYPANSVVPPTLPPSTSTSTTSTQYSLATTPSYDLPHRTQTTEIPVQYLQSTPLLCRCDAFSEDQQRCIAPTQDNSHVSTSWWPAPSIPSPSEPPQQQTVTACTHCYRQAVTLPAAPPSAHPHTHVNPSFPLPIPAATTTTTTTTTTTNNRTHSSPQPSPLPPRPSLNPIPTNPATSSLPDQPRPVAGPLPFPRADGVLNRTRKPDARSESGFDFDFDFESDYGAMRWPHCHVCNDKPALKEKEGVLFCLGCWAEAERAEVEVRLEMERGRRM